MGGALIVDSAMVIAALVIMFTFAAAIGLIAIALMKE